MVALALLASGHLLTFLRAEDPLEQTLTNETVVRMTAQRMPEEAILQAIRTAKSTAFDLDPDIVVELRRAGVSEKVIEAMRQVQAAGRRPPPDPAPLTRELDLVFDGQGEKDWARRSAVMPARDYNDRPISLAFYLYCTDQLHVLDMWQARTPLYARFPRHHLFWFHDRTRPYKQSRRGALVYLDLPESVKLRIEEGAHQVEAGVAVKVGEDAWEPIAVAKTSLEVSANRPEKMLVRVKTHRADRFSRALGGIPSIVCEIVEPAGGRGSSSQRPSGRQAPGFR